MINYDIPWNPVRLEQRMGRIHRYGQEKDCLIFNFVSTNTREGRVLQKLFERIKAIEDDLDPQRTGKVFNVLGDVFPANQLERMIRDMYARNRDRRGHQEPHRRRGGHRRGSASITNSTLEGLAKSELNLSAIIGKSAEAKERRLVPEVIEDFFVQAAPIAGIHAQGNPARTARLSHRPRSRATLAHWRTPGTSLRQARPRIQADRLRQEAADNEPTLEWVTPGHPLFEAVREDVLDRVRDDLQRGSVFYDLHARNRACSMCSPPP